jgi:hypothetical protein
MIRANLNRFGVTATWTADLIRDLTSQALTELTDIYMIHYAVLQSLQHAQNR